MKNSKFLVTAAAAVFVLSACKKGGFDTTDSGLQYIIHKDTKGTKPQEGDVITFQMVYKTDKDSTIFDTYKQGTPVTIPLQKPTFKGSLEEGFAMLAVGDSATFKVSADSVFEKTFKMSQMPPFIKKGSFLTFNVKMEKIQPKADAEKEFQAKREAAMKEAEARKTQEPLDIENYLKTNKITVKPTESGLLYMPGKVGTGTQASEGKTAVVEYTGKFLDGKVFDSSVGRSPLEFKIGQGSMIPGFEEAIKKMKVGGKASFILPSKMAYGEQGMQGGIPPYTPLLFEVELKDVK